ncbi:MAG: hypothetical protein V4729_06120 [Pseudomonadota bacterium]
MGFNKYSRLVLVACAGLLLSACSFRSGELPNNFAWPPASAAPKAVQFKLRAVETSNGELYIYGSDEATWRKDIRREFLASGLFSAVDEQTDRSPSAHALVEVVGRDDFTYSPVLSQLNQSTFFIVPDRSCHNYTLTMTFKDAGGKVLGTIEKREKVVYWSQIALLPFSPFTLTVRRKVRADLIRSTLAEARQLGYL